MKNNIYLTFSGGFQKEQFIRLDDNEEIQLYIGKDANGRYAFEFRGRFTPTRIVSSEVISVAQTKYDTFLSLCFSLENPDLLEYFCTFCEDLVESTKDIRDDNIAYRTLCARYLSWKRLFKPHQGRLSEQEIMGLIGELLYLKDVLFDKLGIAASIDGWTGIEYMHKDFSFDDEWHEVKAISSGKGSVRISSIEQLDSNVDGTLVVYELERMSPSFNGIRLNSLVADILTRIAANPIKDVFMTKLSQCSYDFAPDYDNFVYSMTGLQRYAVTQDFPRLMRNNIPISIQRVQYEIILAEIEPYKLHE